MDYTITDEHLKDGVPVIEVYPACEHRFRDELPDGSEYCWICGETLKEAK